MIASLRGALEAVTAEWAVISVGGIGFQVFMPSSTLSELGTDGNEVRVFTHTHVREDVLALYGFLTPDELQMFEMLLSVSGIGPRTALGMLSAMSVDQLVNAFASGNIDLLTSVPGIGKKTASRMLLELKDKINTGLQMPASAPASYDNDVLAALISLGYSTNEAMRAITKIPAGSKNSLEDKVKMALGYLGK